MHAVAGHFVVGCAVAARAVVFRPFLILASARHAYFFYFVLQAYLSGPEFCTLAVRSFSLQLLLVRVAGSCLLFILYSCILLSVALHFVQICPILNSFAERVLHVTSCTLRHCVPCLSYHC